jgi:hypothetical protein
MSTRLTLSRRLLSRSHAIRGIAPLSPLYPAQFKAFTASTSAAMASGDYLQNKGGEAETPNPLDPKNMDSMMDGMKKQAVMM